MLDLEQFVAFVGRSVLFGNAVGFSVFATPDDVFTEHPFQMGSRILPLPDAPWAPSGFGGSKWVGPHDLMHVESVSKTITALAVMIVLTDEKRFPSVEKELKKKQVPPVIFGGLRNINVLPFLPGDFQAVAGPGVDKLTFYHLLTHTSGLLAMVSAEALGSPRGSVVPKHDPARGKRLRDQDHPRAVSTFKVDRHPVGGGGGSMYEELRESIRRGTFKNSLTQTISSPSGATRTQPNSDPPGDRVYANLNFALFRIILPYLVNGRNTMEDARKALSQAEFERVLGTNYVAICREALLNPVGLGEVDIAPSNCLYYNQQDPTQSPGADDSREHMLLGVGPNGWKLSAFQMAKLILEANSRSPQLLQYMKDHRIACRPLKGLTGTYFGKDGLGRFDDTGKGRAGLHSAWIWFPSLGELIPSIASGWPGTIATININSNNNLTSIDPPFSNDPLELLANAYDLWLWRNPPK